MSPTGLEETSRKVFFPPSPADVTGTLELVDADNLLSCVGASNYAFTLLSPSPAVTETFELVAVNNLLSSLSYLDL